jgi:flagella basal body P-ring formation protein FlgA
MINVVLLLILSTPLSWSQGSSIEAVIQKMVQKEVQKECATCEVELILHNKSLVEDVAKPDRVIADRWKGQTNLILRVGEDTRIITATIRWKDKILIAKNNIPVGQVLTAKHLERVKKDVTYLQTPYLTHEDEARGLATRRVFKRGQVLDSSYLKKPIAIKFGQPVEIQFNTGALALSMSGEARGAGAIGDRIPVIVNNTKKRMSAVILSKNQVRVE